MFTPPPSPHPPVRQTSPSSEPDSAACHCTDGSQHVLSKQRWHLSIRWTIILVPLSLILLAAFTRSWVHPAVFDLLSTDHDHEPIKWTMLANWSLHAPHKSANAHLAKRSASSAPGPSNTATAVPTVPVNPILPSPFPSAFDTTLSANFSTTSCYDFFLNMTAVDPFLSCRPFSLLIATSMAFQEAQKNISLMNTDVWGTCNTDLSQAQCDANMSWFASSLQASCQIDLANQVATVIQTIRALHAYDLMRDVACQVDPATNAYCYVEAVANTDPSRYWFYELPLGQTLPNITTGACNECTTSLMASYAQALNSTNGTALTGLRQTYDTAADQLNNVCGSSYAKEVQVAGTSSPARVDAGVPTIGSLLALGVLVVAASM